MKNFAQKSGRTIIKVVLILGTLSLILLVVIQMILFLAINALNAGKAHDFIQAQITSAMTGTGLNASFQHLFYDPVRGFTLSDFVLADKTGTVATIDQFSLQIAFSKIALRQLDMVATVGEANLIRLPETEADQIPEPENKPLQPFSLPNVYFKTFKISHFNIAKLIVGEDVAGTAMSFSPSFKAVVSLGEKITLDASLRPKAKLNFGDVSLPENIELQGNFDPSLLSFVLDKFSVASPDYSLTGKGEGNLNTDGQINVALKAAYPDLKKLTQDQFESANLSLIVNGSSEHPALKMDGAVIPATLKEKGLTDIIITANAEDILAALKGAVNIKTSYLENPISLDAELAYSAPVLTLTSLKATAPFVDVAGVGTLSTENNIFDGKISVSASDLSYYKDLLSMNLAGALKAEANLEPQNSIQSADIKASATDIQFDEMKLQKANAELHFDNLNYLWPQTGNVQISNFALADGVFLDKVNASIKDIGNEAYTLSLTGNAHVPSAVSFKGNANLSNLTNAVPTARDIDLTANLGRSAVSLTGAFNPDAIDLQIVTKNFRGSDIPTEVPEAFANIRLNGDVTMTGTPALPVTKAHVNVNGVNSGAYKNLNIAVDANHQDNQVTLSVLGRGAGIQTLKANTAFPLTFAVLPFTLGMDMNAPLSGEALADLDLGTISTLFLPPTQTLSAKLKANGTIAGTLGAPDVKGALTIQNGQFVDEQNGIELHTININSNFTKDSFVLESLKATDGDKGVMAGNGRVGLSPDESTNLDLTIKNFHLPQSKLVNGIFNASFSLGSVSEGYNLKGAVDIDHVNVMIPETFQSKIPELNIVDRKTTATDAVAKTLSLAIKVNAPNQVFVRGWGLDAEFGGELDISGDAAAPQFNGTFASKRGRYEEFGKRFTLDHANLRFQGEMPPSPYLDILATVPADDVTASIALAGPVTSPAITFSSTPALPQDEVLSRLLFGSNTEKISPFQAIQLAQTLARFSGKGGGTGIDPLGMLRSVTGLDDISVDTDANGETNVGVGKYLTDKVYLEFEKGKAPGSGAANIQIEVTPSINVESEIGQDAQTGGGVFWKHDY